MKSLKHLITEVKYDYGCVMAQIPTAYAAPILAFGKQIISDDILYFDPNEPDDYGREDELHVTVKFGFTQSFTKNQMARLVALSRPFSIEVHGLDVFSNEKFDVIKLNIEGKELRELRAIFDRFPNADTYKEYHPHMSLAYVKAGEGAKFKGKILQKFSRIPISIIKYSDRGNPSFYRL